MFWDFSQRKFIERNVYKLLIRINTFQSNTQKFNCPLKLILSRCCQSKWLSSNYTIVLPAALQFLIKTVVVWRYRTEKKKYLYEHKEVYGTTAMPASLPGPLTLFAQRRQVNLFKKYSSWNLIVLIVQWYMSFGQKR